MQRSALADLEDDRWTPKNSAAKERFDETLDDIRLDALAAGPAFFDDLADANESSRVSRYCCVERRRGLS